MERLAHTHSDDRRELLSAYSDNAVDMVERRRAEEYIQDCNACAQELRELRMFKELLRDLPQLQPPRSFTLDPHSAPRPRWRLFPTLRLASALAALLLVVVLGVDGLGGMGSASSPTSGPPSEALTQRNVQQGAEAAIQAEAQPAAGAAGTTGGEAEAAAGAASTAAAPSQAAAAPMASAAASEAAVLEGAPAQEDATAGDAGAAPAGEAPVAGGAADAAASSAAESAAGGVTAMEGAPAATAAAAASPEAAQQPALEAPEPAGADTVTTDNSEVGADNATPSPFDTMLLLELVLALAAVSFGVGAYLAWRRGV